MARIGVWNAEILLRELRRRECSLDYIAASMEMVRIEYPEHWPAVRARMEEIFRGGSAAGGSVTEITLRVLRCLRVVVIVQSSDLQTAGPATKQEIDMNTYVLYISAKMTRTIKAECIADAVKQCPEFTAAVIWAAGHGAHQWFGLAAVELICI